ncbi:MAG: thioredoxin family protein [Candidatus Cloacimonetes bacterium]|jgi:thioredoxin 1|nr:thioredoxin family protein [Candidatus Cloacimonadota bacterium]MBT5421250.1 thioredoxin family protein [Candidatus Cloacimonadota bacterium]
MKKTTLLLLLLIAISVYCFAEETVQDTTKIKPKITFLELGSTTCIPCKQMEKVLESVREKYGDQIDVIFYDVKNEKEITKKYKIKMIPTQVFLDENGNEIHRHVGFYPEEKIDEFLKEQGLQILPTKQHE